MVPGGTLQTPCPLKAKGIDGEQGSRLPSGEGLDQSTG